MANRRYFLDEQDDVWLQVGEERPRCLTEDYKTDPDAWGPLRELTTIDAGDETASDKAGGGSVGAGGVSISGDWPKGVITTWSSSDTTNPGTTSYSVNIADTTFNDFALVENLLKDEEPLRNLKGMIL